MPGIAPVYSITEEHRARAEAAAWSRFAAPGDSQEFHAAWLALLGARVERARAALLLVGGEHGAAFTVAAAWPDPQRDLQYLGAAAQRALTERCGVVTAPEGGPPTAESGAHVGYPVEVSGRLCAAIVLDIGPHGDLQAALRQIHWASAWLLDHFRQAELRRRENELERVGLLNELMAAALQHRRLQSSALAVANQLAATLRCDRVAIGFEESGSAVPLVLSHTATFDARSDLLRTLGAAMDEVLDLGVAMRYPPTADDEIGAMAHDEAARTLKVEAMLSAPLLNDGQTLGVITFERNAGPAFDEGEQRVAHAIGVMLGPIWALQRANERGLVRRLREHAGASTRALFGPRHPGLRLIGAVLAGALLAAVLIPAEYHVSARTVIEGSTQLAAVAPFDGFIAEGVVRAGDTVRRGQPLARLDERDLALERRRWLAERVQLQRKYQAAMASADRSAMGVLAAQVNQAEAQLALAQEKLSRATLLAPFDGIVVSGDLSQQIGTPVEQGKVLFEVAPLEGYRVVLQVDDRDIARLAVGQRGELVLASLPDRKLPFTVSTITPVATQHDGRNEFRVEAGIDPEHADRLRPGMEGIGKVDVGENSLLWIWTHRFTDWLRLALWNWMP